MRSLKLLAIFVLLGSPTLVGLTRVAAAQEREMLLATTTSVNDSGLLDDLLPEFTRETGIHVRVIAAGTGAALRMGAEGNADVLLTHAPPAEIKLLQQGVLISRTEFMENYFVLAGPPADPARAMKAGSIAQAYRNLAASGARYISRGDDSGTHRKEKMLLASAGLETKHPWEGFQSSGSGMGLTLQVAGERRAYVLSDIGTFLAFRERIGLVILSKPEPVLRNVYSVLQIDPKRFKHPIHSAEAKMFAQFLTRSEIQQRIARFGKKRFGRPLFRPLHPGDKGARD